MVVVSDLVNDISDIHPSLKKQVGVRLANMALKKTYHREEVEPYSPMLKSIRIEGRKVMVATAIKLTCNDKTIQNFEIVDQAGNVYPADAKLMKNGEISVSSSKVKTPVAVRYCFTNDAFPIYLIVTGCLWHHLEQIERNEKIFINPI